VNDSEAFVEQMRAQTDRGSLWSDIKWGALVLALAALGTWFLVVGDPSSYVGSRLMGAGMLVGAAIGAFFIVRGAVRRRSPAGHPLNLQFAAYGEADAVAQDIEADFQGRRFVARRVQVGRRWLCYAGKGQITVQRLDRLVWVYTERVKHRINMFIPYRPSSYQLLLWDHNGRGAAVPVRKRGAPPALAALQNAVPWLFIGYSETLKESWNADRPEFISLVESRRQQALSRQSAS